jgi:hypothetical protein
MRRTVKILQRFVRGVSSQEETIAWQPFTTKVTFDSYFIHTSISLDVIAQTIRFSHFLLSINIVT